MRNKTTRSFKVTVFRNLSYIICKMSSIVKKRINLEFISGQVEEDIAVEDVNQTLGEFIEGALLRLEVNLWTIASMMTWF